MGFYKNIGTIKTYEKSDLEDRTFEIGEVFKIEGYPDIAFQCAKYTNDLSRISSSSSCSRCSRCVFGVRSYINIDICPCPACSSAEIDRNYSVVFRPVEIDS